MMMRLMTRVNWWNNGGNAAGHINKGAKSAQTHKHGCRCPSVVKKRRHDDDDDDDGAAAFKAAVQWHALDDANIMCMGAYIRFLHDMMMTMRRIYITDATYVVRLFFRRLLHASRAFCCDAVARRCNNINYYYGLGYAVVLIIATFLECMVSMESDFNIICFFTCQQISTFFKTSYSRHIEKHKLSK